MSRPYRGYFDRNARFSWRALKNLFSYIASDKLRFYTSVLLTIIASIAQNVVVIVQRPIINGIVEHRPWSQLVRLFILFPVVSTLAALIMIAAHTLISYSTFAILKNLRLELFRHLQSLPISYFDQRSHGNIMSVISNDVSRIRIFYGSTISQVLISITMIIVNLLLLLRLSPALTRIALLVIIPPLFIGKAVAKYAGRYYADQQDSIGKSNGYIVESITGARLIKAYQHESQRAEEFDKLNRELQVASTKANALSMITFPLIGNLGYIQTAIVAVVGGHYAIAGKLDLGAFITFLTLLQGFIPSLVTISSNINDVVQAIAAGTRVHNILIEKSESDDGEIHIVDSKFLLPSEDGSIETRPVIGEVEIHGLDFSYEEGRPILKNINLWAHPGQRIALVGSTGAGKTTITNLINRFYEIDTGEILIDGIDIRRLKKPDLRNLISVVLQETHLFRASIRENIRFGRLDASDEEVIEAAKAANAHDFISALEGGYDFELIDDGMNLSQGQRQLISIARATIAARKILILDEATSSVDTRTEKLIELGMDNLMQKSTTFAIAHRLSTVRDANTILVIEAGEIIERGTHDELMALGGTYYQLCTGQRRLS